MKYILVLIIPFLLFKTYVEVKKRNMPYPDVIAESDIIVDGRIEKVNETYYFFKINDFIKGDEGEEIKVKLWKDWTCDFRSGWKPEPGQRLLLFLKLQQDGFYFPINGSTGELFVNEDNMVKRNLHHEYPKVYDIRFGVKKFLEAFEITTITNTKGSVSYKFKRRVSKKEIEKVMEQSSFFTQISKGYLDY